MSRSDSDIERLLARAAGGDPAAREELLAVHRRRLVRMVAVRLDRRVAGRIDPSDVVQEALLEAAGKLPDYLRQRPVAFYPWLRRLAWEHLLKAHQRHLGARRRSVAREQEGLGLPDESVLELAARLVGKATSPSHQLLRQELCQRVRSALAQLPEADREVLVLRYLEQLPLKEIALVLGLQEGAVKMRHTRALTRLSRLLGEDTEGGQR
jgi:RNA polymerase sigma-70 factor (ECF subfamily)